MNDELLKLVVERLDVLIHLSIPAYTETNYNFSGLPVKIIELCDFEHTRNDIISKLGKPANQIDPALTKLRQSGIIRSVIKNQKTYYVRVK